MTLRLLFTGGFCGRKGSDDILKAIQLLHEKGIVFHFDVVGDYSDAERQLFGKYPIAALPVTFHGHVPQDELKKFLAGSDIYLFPSLAEGCASSGMEAMAAGLCVIATRESGLPITDGANGIIVPANAPDVIVDRVCWLAANPYEIERLGKNGAKYIREKCTWDKYAETVGDVYFELMGN